MRVGCVCVYMYGVDIWGWGGRGLVWGKTLVDPVRSSFKSSSKIVCQHLQAPLCSHPPVLSEAWSSESFAHCQPHTPWGTASAYLDTYLDTSNPRP